MRRLLIIGIGAGDPDYITVQAINALNEADVFFVLDKGLENDDLSGLRREICERYITDHAYRYLVVADPPRDRTTTAYTAAVQDWHESRAVVYEELMLKELGDDGTAAILVWGDPSLYDSTLRVVEHLQDRGVLEFDWEVIPGISSVQALAARHRLLLNRIGEPVHITTGRLLTATTSEIDNVVVMLDSHCAFMNKDPDLLIYWGAYLGTPDEVLFAGRIGDVGEHIVQRRAQLRADKGWIMDTYVLRRASE